jgi:hypothetical protein
MKNRIEVIKEFCKQNNIRFQCLTTPARCYRTNKQEE